MLSFSLLSIWHHITSLHANQGANALWRLYEATPSLVATCKEYAWTLGFGLIFSSLTGRGFYRSFVQALRMPVALRRIPGTWWTVRPSPTRLSLSICGKERITMIICCGAAFDLSSFCVKDFKEIWVTDPVVASLITIREVHESTNPPKVQAKLQLVRHFTWQPYRVRRWSRKWRLGANGWMDTATSGKCLWHRQSLNYVAVDPTYLW